MLSIFCSIFGPFKILDLGREGQGTSMAQYILSEHKAFTSMLGTTTQPANQFILRNVAVLRNVPWRMCVTVGLGFEMLLLGARGFRVFYSLTLDHDAEHLALL